MSRKIVGVTVGTPLGPDSLLKKLNIDQRIEEYLRQNPPEPGDNGYSPTVSVAVIEGGYRITIVDVNDTKIVDVFHGQDGTDGTDGTDGATFTPAVDEDGNLSWSNNQGLDNPPTVNIKGLKGDPYELTADDIQRIVEEISSSIVGDSNIVEF